MLPLALLPSALQFGGGLLQSIFGGSAASKAQKKLENLQTPSYNGSRPINDYYNKALERYGVDPTNSVSYKRDQQQIGSNLSAGIGALQDRRSALESIGGLVSNADASTLSANAKAEADQAQRFGQLGSAAQLKNQDDLMAFNTNQMLPFQKQLQLLNMKAGAANSVQSAGFSNIFGGLSNAAAIYGDYKNK